MPRRPLTTSKALRWFNNLGIVTVNTLIVRILFPLMPVGFALIASEKGWGLLNNLHLPFWLDVLAGIVIFDFFIYLQHVVFHSMPVLWRLHMVHHCDLDFDLTTGIRFHPVEIVLSMIIKLGIVYLFGPPALSVLIFEIILNSASMFNHSNFKLPLTLDRLIRLFIVTPDMHRVHHSVIIRERNSNFGFNLSIWDRMLGTYRDQPGKGHMDMVIGLANFREPAKLNLPRLLTLPFTDKHP